MASGEGNPDFASVITAYAEQEGERRRAGLVTELLPEVSARMGKGLMPIDRQARAYALANAFADILTVIAGAGFDTPSAKKLQADIMVETLLRRVVANQMGGKRAREILGGGAC